MSHQEAQITTGKTLGEYFLYFRLRKPYQSKIDAITAGVRCMTTHTSDEILGNEKLYKTFTAFWDAYSEGVTNVDIGGTVFQRPDLPPDVPQSQWVQRIDDIEEYCHLLYTTADIKFNPLKFYQKCGLPLPERWRGRYN